MLFARPETNIKVNEYKKFIGLKLKKDVQRFDQIKRKDFK